MNFFYRQKCSITEKEKWEYGRKNTDYLLFIVKICWISTQKKMCQTIIDILNSKICQVWIPWKDYEIAL